MHELETQPPEPVARLLACQACLNVRDVGGYATADGSRTRWRALLRGDNLCQLTPDGRAALLDAGIRSIVDLRHAAELSAAQHPFAPGGPDAGAVDYLSIPPRDPTDAALAAAFRAAPSLLATYRLTLDRCAPALADVARAFADARPGAVLVHCNVGKDRTGVVVALLLALAGVRPETIAADYALSAEHLRPLYEARRAAGLEDTRREWHAPPETMLALLAHLDVAHGGASRYLAAAGLSPAELDRAHARLRG
jgi:protein-tyrosine phosphatase